MGTIPQAWYLQEEREWGTCSWQAVADKFVRCFLFEGEMVQESQALQAVKEVFFFHHPESDGGPVVSRPEVRRELVCHRIDGDPEDDSLEDLRHLYFDEREGEQSISEELTTEGFHL